MIRLRRDWPQLAGLTIGLALVALAVHGSYVFGIPLWQFEVGCFVGPAVLGIVLAMWEKAADRAEHRDKWAADMARWTS